PRQAFVPLCLVPVLPYHGVRFDFAHPSLLHALVSPLNHLAWANHFTVMSIAIAFRGLEAVMSVAVPFIVFLYPPAITLIVLTLVQPLVRKVVGFYWAYRLSLWG